MCKAHSKVTRTKQQKYFHHFKGRGSYNKEMYYIYPSIHVFISRKCPHNENNNAKK